MWVNLQHILLDAWENMAMDMVHHATTHNNKSAAVFVMHFFECATDARSYPAGDVAEVDTRCKSGVGQVVCVFRWKMYTVFVCTKEYLPNHGHCARLLGCSSSLPLENAKVHLVT